jgi:type VI secretion system protein ImpG
MDFSIVPGLRMKDLLPYFERELVVLRRYGAEFGSRFPRVAGGLYAASGDPHAERVLQGTALLAARIQKRLDDGYPQVTERLLESLYPHCLRPFPSCSTVAFDAPGPASAPRVIPRGTDLASKQAVAGVHCRFRTAADVSLAPVAIRATTFDPLIRAPSGTKLGADVTASLSITIASVSGLLTLHDMPLEKLRVFIDGDPSLSAALRDALFLHASGAFVEAPDGRWLPLAESPIIPAGFSEAEALIPYGRRSHPAWRILLEYFCFPDKFRFFDLDLAALRPFLPTGARSVTLHLALAGIRPDASAARMLRAVGPANLRLFCAPVVNLFPHHARPVAVTGTTADYSLVPDVTRPEGYEVYAVDAVRKRSRDGEGIVEFKPMHACRNPAAAKGYYWALRHDDVLAEISPGYEKRLSVIDEDLSAQAAERSTVSADILCTNRDLPHQLSCGVPGGDLSVSATADGIHVRLLATPTRQSRFASGEAQWALNAYLTLNHHALIPDGLDALRELLKLHDLPQSSITQRMIDGVVGLDHRQVTGWMCHEYGQSLVHGIEVHITVDEEAFAGSGMHLFAQVMDQFLALYVQVNNFVELVLLAQRDKREIIRCKRRSGNASPA